MLEALINSRQLGDDETGPAVNGQPGCLTRVADVKKPDHGPFDVFATSHKVAGFAIETEGTSVQKVVPVRMRRDIVKVRGQR